MVFTDSTSTSKRRSTVERISISINAGDDVVSLRCNRLTAPGDTQPGKPLFQLVGDGMLIVLIPTYIASHGIDAGDLDQLLEQFGYFADSIALESSQEALLGEISAQEVADKWAEFLTEEYGRWKAAQ